MADLLIDSQGRPVPQYLNSNTNTMEASTGANGSMHTILNAALPEGSNKIGKVDVDTLPILPAGTNKIGSVDIDTFPVLPEGSNKIGKVDVDTFPVLPEGSNKIGKVDVDTLPALSAGSNKIGSVDINLPKFITTTITLTAGTPSTIKSTAGYIARLITTLTDLVIHNDTTQVLPATGNIEFMHPIYCDTSIILSSATGGEVCIEYL